MIGGLIKEKQPGHDFQDAECKTIHVRLECAIFSNQHFWSRGYDAILAGIWDVTTGSW